MTRLTERFFKSTVSHTSSNGGNSYVVIHNLDALLPDVELYLNETSTGRRNMADYNYTSPPDNRGWWVRNIENSSFVVDIYNADGYIGQTSDIDIIVKATR